MTTAQIADAPAVPEAVEIEDAVLTALEDLDAPTYEGAEGDTRFRIADNAQADWAARKLARARARQAEVRAIAQRQRDSILEAIRPHMQRIDEWSTEEEGRLAGEEQFFEGLLVEYHRNVLAEDPRQKTIRLPHGSLHARKGQDEWQTDDAVLIEWAQKSGAEILRVKTEVDRREMKRMFSVGPHGESVWAGEFVPGVQVVPGAVTFSVETEEVEK